MGSPLPKQGTEPLRVVLIGKTGTGKSSSGNTLLGKEAFKVKASLQSVTPICQWKETVIGDIRLQVTDTPGLCDTFGREEHVLKEIGKSVAVARPGPHVILMVLKGNARFTKDEFQAYQTLIQLFGDGIKKHMIVLFVGIDNYGSSLSEQQKNFKAEIKKQTGDVTKLFFDADNRVYGINNKAQGRELKRQSQELLDQITLLWNQNGREHYVSKISEQVRELVNPLVQECIEKGSRRDQAETKITKNIVKERVKPDFYKRLGEVVKACAIPAIQLVLGIANVAVAASICSIM